MHSKSFHRDAIKLFILFSFFPPSFSFFNRRSRIIESCSPLNLSARIVKRKEEFDSNGEWNISKLLLPLIWEFRRKGEKFRTMEGMSGRGCTNNTSIEIQSIGVEAQHPFPFGRDNGTMTFSPRSNPIDPPVPMVI